MVNENLSAIFVSLFNVYNKKEVVIAICRSHHMHLMVWLRWNRAIFIGIGGAATAANMLLLRLCRSHYEEIGKALAK